MAVSNLNSCYRFSVHTDDNGILNIGYIEEMSLDVAGGYYGYDCSKIQAVEFEEQEKVCFVSRFYDQLLYFRMGMIVTLQDLPKVSFL